MDAVELRLAVLEAVEVLLLLLDAVLLAVWDLLAVLLADCVAEPELEGVADARTQVGKLPVRLQSTGLAVMVRVCAI